MPPLEAAAIVILALHAFVWFARWERTCRRRLAATPLLESAATASSHPPSVNVFVPARNEEHAIERCVRSLLAQDHPALHVIVINDRSTDRTGEILGRISDPRLTIIDTPPLPDGWMGKCHALHCGVKAAPTESEFYLFTDADVIFAPDTVRRAASHLARGKGDLLTLFPRVDCVGFWENAILPLLSHLGFLTLDPKKITNPDTKDFIGIGAFGMIRRAMYERWGGHAAIRNEVIDDMAMGLMTKSQRGRILITRDFTAIHLRWYHGLSSIVRGFEKNMHQAVGHGISGAIAAALFFPLAHAIPLMIAIGFLLLDPGAWYVWLSALLLHVETGLKLVGRMRRAHSMNPLVVALAYPAGAFLASYIMLRSAYFAEIKGEIRWRGRSLPRGKQRTRLVR